IMADLNIPANDAPIEQAPAIAPPTRTDDQILPLSKWVPIDILRDALDITLANDNNPFVAPPSSDTVIKYVNMLGYPAKASSALDALGKNLATAARGKKKIAHLFILSVRFVGKDGKVIFGMPIPDALLTDEIKGAPYYGDYQEHVANYQQFLDAERGKAEEGGATESFDTTKVTKPKAAKVTKPASDKAPKPTTTQPPKPKPAPTQPSKVVSEKKRKLVKETPDEPSPAKRSKGGLVGKRRKPKSPLKFVDEPSDERVPVEEPTHTNEEADLQWALELKVQGKGKEKVIDEQAWTKPCHVVHAGPNREHMDLEATDASSQQKPEKMDEEFTTSAYPNVPRIRELNAETEVQLMVSVPIHQDTSSVPPMTTPVIDLMTMQSDSPLPASKTTTSIITTTTSLPPPPQP
ncbi:hypothetical protein Tco_0767879, partial [Tanacetum coccineum]